MQIIWYTEHNYRVSLHCEFLHDSSRFLQVQIIWFTVVRDKITDRFDTAHFLRHTPLDARNRMTQPAEVKNRGLYYCITVYLIQNHWALIANHVWQEQITRRDAKQ